MDKIRIGNDIHIEWSIFRDNQPEEFEGKDVEVRLIHTRTRDVIPLEWVISDGVVSATFYGKDQIDTGDYKLMLVENNGAPNMATIDECKAFTLVQCSCQEQKEDPSTSLQLHKVYLTSSFALSGGGNISVEGYPNVDELEEVKELSGNENIIITDSEGNKKTTIGNLKEYVVKDISELPPFRIFETELDYNAVKDELGDCVVCLRDTGVMLYHVYKKTEEGGGEIEDKYIRFADPEVQRILVENFSSDGVGMTSEDIEKVTSIGNVFRGNTEITSFDELEKFIGLTKIAVNISYNYGVFEGCSNLRSVKFPPTLVEIEKHAFTSTPALEIDVNIPTLQKLGHAAFHASGISKVSCLGNITELVYESNYNSLGMFSSCTNLTDVTLPESVSALSGYCFFGDTLLSVLNVAWENITKIGVNTFYNCTSLEIEDLNLPNLKSLGQNAFYGVKIKKISNLGKLTSLPTASPSTQNFGDKSTLEEVVLPETLTSIPSYSFYNYTALKVLSGGEGVKEIEVSSFNSTAIEEVSFPSLEILNSEAFRLSKIKRVNSLGNVTQIKQGSNYTLGAFYNCADLEYVDLPTTITFIGAGTFYGNSKLVIDISLPNLETLGQCAFTGSGITKVLDLGKITRLEDGQGYYQGVFNSCVNLEVVILPDTMSYIGRQAFADNAKLKALICKSIAPCEVYGGMLDDSNNAIIYVPDASVEAYKTATNWSSYASRIKGISELPTDNAELYEEIKDYLS